MKKLYVYIFLIVGFLGVIIIFMLGMRNQHETTKLGEKYLVVNESLIHQDDTFELVSQNFVATELGDIIGFTDKNQQVFSIPNQKQGEWVIVRDNDREYLFKNIKVKFFSVANYKIDKVDIKNGEVIDATKTSVNDEQTVSALQKYMTDENLVKVPEEVSEMNDIYLSNAKVPEIQLHLLYLHDNEGNCFLYDFIEETCWSVGHELMGHLE